MSLSLEIDAKDYASGPLNLLDNALRRPLPIHQYIADSCTAITRDLFGEMGARPNRSNWRPTGFWQRMLSGTVAVATAEAAIVRMPREVAQRFFGGMIYPTAGKHFLSLPARSEAYGKSPREFSDLQFIPTGPDKGILVQKDSEEQYGRKRKDGSRKTREIGGGVFFYLVKSVFQAADSSVLPSDEQYLAAAKRGLNNYLGQFV